MVPSARVISLATRELGAVRLAERRSMSNDLLGQLFSILNAVTWAAALVFFKKSGENIPPLALNLFKNIVGVALLLITLVVVPLVVTSESPMIPAHLSSWDSRGVWVLLLSGMIGIAIADTMFFFSLNLGGVSLFAIIECLYTPFVILFSWLMLEETLTAHHYIGGAMILGAVFLTAGHAPPANRTRRQMFVGTMIGAASMALMAFGIVYAKPVLHDAPVLWATTLRLIGGTALLLGIAVFTPGLRAVARPFRPSRDWRFSMPGAVLGAYLAMIFWIAGFAHTRASVAAMLNQCSSIFAILLAAVFLKEKLTARKVLAVVVAFGGVGVVVLGDSK